MAPYVYVGDEGRYYTEFGITPAIGETHELDEAPTDGRWTHPDGSPVVVADMPVDEPAPKDEAPNGVEPPADGEPQPDEVADPAGNTPDPVES